MKKIHIALVLISLMFTTQLTAKDYYVKDGYNILSGPMTYSQCLKARQSYNDQGYKKIWCDTKK